MNPESKFSRWLCSEILTMGHAQRIENTAGSGVPDINYCFKGQEAWIETKIGWPKLRPYQWAWMRRRVTYGGRVIIISEIDNTICLWRANELIVTLHGKHLEPENDPIQVDRYNKSLDRINIVHNFILK